MILYCKQNLCIARTKIHCIKYRAVQDLLYDLNIISQTIPQVLITQSIRHRRAVDVLSFFKTSAFNHICFIFEYMLVSSNINQEVPGFIHALISYICASSTQASCTYLFYKFNSIDQGVLPTKFFIHVNEMLHMNLLIELHAA